VFKERPFPAPTGAPDIVTYLTWGGNPVGAGAPTTITVENVPAAHVIVEQIHIAGNNSGVQLLDGTSVPDINSSSSVEYMLFTPWRATPQLLPVFETLQSMHGSWTAHYYSGTQYKNYDFPGVSAVGIA